MTPCRSLLARYSGIGVDKQALHTQPKEHANGIHLKIVRSKFGHKDKVRIAFHGRLTKLITGPRMRSMIVRCWAGLGSFSEPLQGSPDAMRRARSASYRIQRVSAGQSRWKDVSYSSSTFKQFPQDDRVCYGNDEKKGSADRVA